MYWVLLKNKQNIFLKVNSLYLSVCLVLYLEAFLLGIWIYKWWLWIIGCILASLFFSFFSFLIIKTATSNIWLGSLKLIISFYSFFFLSHYSILSLLEKYSLSITKLLNYIRKKKRRHMITLVAPIHLHLLAAINFLW